MKRQTTSELLNPIELGPVRIRALAVGAKALGTLAIGSLAIGAIGLCVVGIGRLFVDRARIRKLHIDELTVGKLHSLGTDRAEVEGASQYSGLLLSVPDPGTRRQSPRRGAIERRPHSSVFSLSIPSPATMSRSRKPLSSTSGQVASDTRVEGVRAG
jgi:hypothetical protein